MPSVAIRFRPDAALRKQLMCAESLSHPAKANLSMMQAIIEKYTVPGDTVLDPMAGVGSTLIAALMGRNVVCVELEAWMMPLLRANWEKMRQHPMLGYSLGNVVILRGDARCLPLLSADTIITSPPFGGEEQHSGGESSTWAKHYSNQATNKGYTNLCSRLFWGRW